jgi:hypothetical protein
MSITFWNRQDSNGNRSRPEAESSTLDSRIQSTLSWSSRVFEIVDLQVERERTDNVFLSTFALDQLNGNSGKNQNSSPPIQLSLKAEGKEIALLSGLIGRHCRILELTYSRLISQSEMYAEIQALRAENLALRTEVDNLYGALDRLQRPKMIS